MRCRGELLWSLLSGMPWIALVSELKLKKLRSGFLPLQKTLFDRYGGYFCIGLCLI